MRDINNNYDDFCDFVAEALEPVVRIAADPAVAEMVRTKKPKLLVAKHLIAAHKDDVASVLAAYEGVTEDAFKGAFSAMKIVKSVLEMLNSPVVEEVFQSAEQKVDATPSVSASESAPE